MRLLGCVAVAAVWVGCYETNTVECGGLLCPSIRVCAPDGVTCVAPDQLASCNTVDDGTGCSYVGVPEGVCRDQVCIPAGCGNGILEPGEVCDDGNRVSLDGCRSDCSSMESCGDGVVDPSLGEACDCGAASVSAGCLGPNSQAPGARCRGDCQLGGCGDGVLDPSELCDDHNLSSYDGCRRDCLGRFQQTPVQSTGGISALWTTSPTNAYAVVAGQLLRFDGSVWTAMVGAPVLISGWASGPNDLYTWQASGSQAPGLQHFDGTSWSNVAFGLPVGAGVSVNSVWGSGANDVYVVGVLQPGSEPLVLHYNGTQWSSIPWCTGTTSHTIRHVSGISASDVLLVDNSSETCRKNGTSWSSGITPGLFGNSTLSADGSHFYLFDTNLATTSRAWRLDGASWTNLGLSAGFPISAGVAIGADRYMVVGDSGLIVEHAAGQWSQVVSPTDRDLRVVAASSPDNVFIGGVPGTIIH